MAESFLEVNDEKRIATIIQNWDEFKRRTIETFKNEDVLNCKSISGIDYDPRVLLEKYYSNFHKGCVRVSYKRSKYVNSGRQFVLDGVGLQAFSKVVRHTLANGFYKDIDIKNCHPILLHQLCKKYGYVCDELKKYIDNRESYLHNICDVNGLDWNPDNKEMAKKVLLSVVNGSIHYEASVVKQLQNKPDWFEAFKNECDNLKILFYKNDDFAKLRKQVLKKVSENGKVNNIEGSLMNHILCDIEDTILQSCIEYCKIKQLKWKNIVKVFDGFMCLLTDSIDYDDLARHIKAHTLYEVEFVEKEMDKVIDLSGLKCHIKTENKQIEVDCYEGEEKIIINDDSQASLMLIDKMKDVIQVSPISYYIKDGVVWCCDKRRFDTLLKLECMGMNFCHKSISSGIITPYSRNKRGCDNIVSVAKDYLFKNPNPKLEEMMFRSVIGKTCFPNGVYDWNTKQFTPWSENTEVYTTIITPMDYNPNRNEAKIKEVYDKVFASSFEGHKTECDDLLSGLASAMSGNPDDKFSMIGFGHRNSGKGSITELCKYTFGDYVELFDSGVFQKNGMEECRRMSFLLDKRYCRLLISNEAPTANNSSNKNASVMDGNLIKKIQGGDYVEARNIFEKPTQFRIQAKVMMFCNDMPSFEPADCLQCMESYSFPYKFVDESKMMEENVLPFYRKADPSIKNYVKDPEVAMAFFHLLTDFYKVNRTISIETKALIENVLEDCGDDETVFKNTFIRSDEESDYITSSEVMNWVREKKLNMSSIKIKKIMIDLGFPYCKDKRINGVRFTGFLFVKRKDYDEE